MLDVNIHRHEEKNLINFLQNLIIQLNLNKHPPKNNKKLLQKIIVITIIINRIF